jgi:glycosyltransferase involved in cell wall biosynthesis
MPDLTKNGRASRDVDLGGRRAVAIIPAYNEADCIQRVIEDLHDRAPWTDVLVVNDGSRDATGARAREAGARVIDLPVNLGIGGAVQTGYRYAREEGYDVAFQFDGDGQHRASRLADLVGPLLAGEADLVIGSRFLAPRGMTPRGMRWVGIQILSVMISLFIRRKVSDPTSGFRAAGRRAIQLFAAEYPQDYPEPESLVLLHKQGLRVCEVPTTMRRRREGTSSIRPLHGFHYMSKVLLAVVMDLFKAPVHLEEEVA